MDTYGGVYDEGSWPDSSLPYGGPRHRQWRERRGKKGRARQVKLTQKPHQRARLLIGTWRLSRNVGDKTALFNFFLERLFPYLAQRRLVPLEATEAKRALKQARSLRIRRFRHTGTVFRWHSDTGQTFWLAIRETDSLTVALDALQYQMDCNQAERNKRLAELLQEQAA